MVKLTGNVVHLLTNVGKEKETVTEMLTAKETLFVGKKTAEHSIHLLTEELTAVFLQQQHHQQMKVKISKILRGGHKGGQGWACPPQDDFGEGDAPLKTFSIIRV